MFSFLPLIYNSVTIGLGCLLISISKIMLSKATNILRFLLGLYSSIFSKISFKSFEYSIKALEPLKFFNSEPLLLLINDWYFASN